MKRLTVIGFVLCCCFNQLHGQTFAEYFQQNKTQKKYLLQQIAALQVYIGYVEKGYKVAKDGLNLIGDLKNGEFSLHKDYFSSLTAISPAVKNYGRIEEIISLQLKIVRNYHEVTTSVKGNSWFNGNESDYIGKVWNNLVNGCAADIDALISLTTPGELGLKENERLQRIDAVYASMQEKYAFNQKFSEDIKALALSREQETGETRSLQWLYGMGK